MKTNLLILLLFVSSQLFAQTYPFDLPENFSATIDINTSEQEEFNNLLLGSNTHDLSKSEGQELVREAAPITIRFPHGLFSNWYDWEQDKARVYGEDNVTYTKSDGSSRTVEISYLSSIKTMDAHNLYVGIDELNTLNNQKKAATGEGYDMMWTFNMSADGTDFNNGSPVSVARYQDLVSRGFEVKAIEMGNENFYAGQRSSIIPNHSDYVARARSMYTALKALDPNLKLSVPLERKSNPANVGWNTDLTKDGTDYFDAVSVHTYVGYDPDDAADSDEAYATALGAREVLRKTIDDYSKVVAPDKPIWLTEWGVRSGGPNAVSALGMADCYMFLSENQDTYERANWFSYNGKLNSHLVWHTVNDKLVIKEPFEKTSYGSTFEILRSVYENSTMLGSEMTTPTLEGVVNAVNARAVKKDGKTILFVVNLSDQEVPFTINIDGERFYGDFEHKAFAFSSMDDEISVPFHTDPLSLVKEGKGGIYLPKYSINTIELKDNETLALDFVDLETGDVIDKGSNLVIEASVADEFAEVSLFVNDTLQSTLTESPYVWSSFPQLTQMIASSYQLKLVGKMQNDEIIEKEITLTTPEQWPYADNYQRHKIPGLIEVENYDVGGYNVAYYDKSEQNTSSYTYRGDDKVDLGSGGQWLKYIQGKEWLEYSVNVERSGTYNIAVKHETRRSPEFSAMSFSFQENGQALFSDLVCTTTASGVSAVDTFSNAYLEKGNYTLRLDILSYGYDMDYFELILKSNPIDYYNIGTLVHSSLPDSYDTGNAIQSLPIPLDSLGFDFAGWYTNAACTDTVTVPVVSATDEEDKAFYAKWQAQALEGSAYVYGDIIEGQTLSIDASNIANNSGVLMYQWQASSGADFVDISGATSSTYTLRSADVGKELRALVSSSLQLGSVVSNVTNVILDTMAETFTITYDANGGTDGKITSELLGAGGSPTFIAQPEKEGYTVVSWTNAAGETIDAQSIVNSDTTVYALWEVKHRFKVSFDMGDSIVTQMTDNYPAYLTSFPDAPLQADSIFDKWYAAYGERFDSTYIIDEDVKVYPTWQVKRFPINVVSGNGTIVYEPEQSTYEIHSQVQITVVPSSRYEFLNWSGDYQGTDTTITVVIDSIINLTANYQRRPYYALDVFTTKGVISKYPYSSLYISGTKVTLTATPMAGYEFDAWSGDYVGTENPLDVFVTKNMEIFANFKEQTSSLNDASIVNLKIYPNPNNGQFTIDLGEDKEASYKLFTISGAEVMKGTFFADVEISIDSYNAGIYLLEVSTADAKSVQRIIIE